MKVIELKSWRLLPDYGMPSVYRADFRKMTAEEAIKAAKIEESYLDYGFNVVFFVQDIGTIFLSRA